MKESGNSFHSILKYSLRLMFYSKATIKIDIYFTLML